MVRWIVAGFVLVTAVDAAAADRGAEVFSQACAACHLESMSAEETEHADGLKAPPMNLLSTIIRKKVGNSEPAFVAHVVDFTTHPAREKVKAMAEAVDRFGLMPPIRETAPALTPEDIRSVAQWLYGHYDYETELKELQAHAAPQPKR